jgi:hypothetical protein
MRKERAALLARRRGTDAREEWSAPEERSSPVIALQRAAGNRAVSSLLAREDKKDGKKGGDEQESDAKSIQFPPPIGRQRLLGFNLGSHDDVDMTLPIFAQVAELEKAFHDGKSLGNVVITIKGVDFVIHDAFVASLQINNDIVVLSLNGFLERKDPKDDEPTGSPDKPSYDVGRAGLAG